MHSTASSGLHVYADAGAPGCPWKICWKSWSRKSTYSFTSVVSAQMSASSAIEATKAPCDIVGLGLPLFGSTSTSVAQSSSAEASASSASKSGISAR